MFFVPEHVCDVYWTYASIANPFPSKQAKFVKTSKEKYCVSFSIPARQWLFSLKEGGGMRVQRKRDRERAMERKNRPMRIGLSLDPFFTVFATTLVDFSRKQG